MNLPLVYLLGVKAGLDLQGVWLAGLLAEALKAVWALALLLLTDWRDAAVSSPSPRLPSRPPASRPPSSGHRGRGGEGARREKTQEGRAGSVTGEGGAGASAAAGRDDARGAP